MTQTSHQRTIFQGETRKFKLTLLDEFGTPVEALAADATSIRVALLVDNTVYVRYAQTPPNSQFRSLDSVTLATVELFLYSEDSATLPPGTLKAQLHAELADPAYPNSTRELTNHYHLGIVAADQAHKL